MSVIARISLPLLRGSPLATLALGLSCVSCVFGNAVFLGASYPPVGAEQVRVVSTEATLPSHEVIGLVTAQIDGTDSAALLQEIRVQGAKLGAQAVILRDVALGDGMWNIGFRASGVAVRFR